MTNFCSRWTYVIYHTNGSCVQHSSAAAVDDNKEQCPGAANLTVNILTRTATFMVEAEAVGLRNPRQNPRQDVALLITLLHMIHVHESNHIPQQVHHAP